MKLLLGVTCLLSATSAAAFEGSMNIEYAASGQKVTSVLFVSSAGDTRVDATAPNPATGKAAKLSMILPRQSKKMLMVVHDQKQFLEIEVPQAGGDSSAVPVDEKRYEVKKIGQQKLLGHDTVHVQVIDKQEKTTADVWLSQVIDWQTLSDLMAQQAQNQDSQAMVTLFKKHGIQPGFPLKMIVRDENKAEKMQMNVTKIDAKKLPAATFQPPKDYQKMTTPGFGGPPPAAPAPAPSKPPATSKKKSEKAPQ